MNKNQVYAELLSAQHIFGVVFHDGRHRLANNNIWLTLLWYSPQHLCGKM